MILFSDTQFVNRTFPHLWVEERYSHGLFGPRSPHSQLLPVSVICFRTVHRVWCCPVCTNNSVIKCNRGNVFDFLTTHINNINNSFSYLGSDSTMDHRDHIIIPDELLKLADHPLSFGRDVARLSRPYHSAGAAFVLSQAETDGLILAVCAHRDEELALVPVLRLPGHRERNTGTGLWGILDTTASSK